MSFKQYLKEALSENVDVLVWDNLEKEGEPVFDGPLEELINQSEFMFDKEPDRIRKEIKTNGESIVGGGSSPEWIIVKKEI